MQAEIDKLSKEHKFNSIEKPKEFYISNELFTVENNCLTPTFKTKRTGVQAKF